MAANIRIGIDLLRFERISRSIQDPSFLTKNFTEKEIAGALVFPNQTVYFGKLFSCKEAVFKALGIEAAQLESWREIEVTLLEDHEPTVTLAETLKNRLDYVVTDCQLSLTYETELVCAVVLLQGV